MHFWKHLFFFIFVQAENRIHLIRLHFMWREQLYSHGLKGMECLWGRTSPLSVSPCAFQVLRIPYKLQSFVVQKTVLF